MSDRIDLFSTPILRGLLPNAGEHNPALLSAIHTKRGADPDGIARSNRGGWHSDTEMMEWAGPSAMALAQFATQQAGAHMTDEFAGGKRDFSWRVEMWANVNAPGNSNTMHCHPGCLWSGVYYPDPGGSDAPDGGGELMLEDPRYPMAYMTVPDLLLKRADGKPMRSQFAIRPQAGLLVLFPSWLKHSVTPHKGTRDRVSIALNLIIGAAEG